MSSKLFAKVQEGGELPPPVPAVPAEASAMVATSSPPAVPIPFAGATSLDGTASNTELGT